MATPLMLAVQCSCIARSTYCMKATLSLELHTNINATELSKQVWYDQGLIEPPKAARGHATSHSTYVDIEI